MVDCQKKSQNYQKVKAFGKLAEIFGKYLEQGSQVAIVGSLRYNKWIDKHDQVRNTAEIVAHSFTFLSGGRQQEAEDELAVETFDNTVSSQSKGKKKTANAVKDAVPF